MVARTSKNSHLSTPHRQRFARYPKACYSPLSHRPYCPLPPPPPNKKTKHKTTKQQQQQQNVRPLFSLNFSWVLQSSQEKLKTNFWGWRRCIMVYICELFLVKYDLNCGACSGSCFTSPFPCLSLIPFLRTFILSLSLLPLLRFFCSCRKAWLFSRQCYRPRNGKVT